MRQSRGWWILVVLVSLGLYGCPGNVCAPGEQQECTCPESGEMGVQSCSDDGQAWSSCQCWNADPDAGDVEPGDAFTDADGQGNGDGDTTPGGTQKVDLLWVLDNSGSMCEEQTALRENFRGFIETLTEAPIDVNMGVTTTHFSSFTEKVAEPGELQSTPHPPVGFGERCSSPARIKKQVNAAVACTKNPNQYGSLKNPTEDEIECALNQTKAACDRAGPDWTTDAVRSDLFPCGDADGDGRACNSHEDFDAVYRDIPKVLRAADYRTSGGGVAVEKLQKDFACMSYVGTRGDAKEQGLKAAVRAVSPCKTGGTVESPLSESPDGCEHAPEEAPNHGLLRDGAKTAVVFMSDENDCSRPKDAELTSKDRYKQCGEMPCYFLSAKEDPSPLYTTDELAGQFRDNLAASKGRESLDEDDVFIASFHGKDLEYGARDGQTIPDVEKGCTSEDVNQSKLREAATVCQTPLGSATGGTRYADFQDQFSQTFPEAGSDGKREGWMCRSDLGGPLKELAEALRKGD